MADILEGVPTGEAKPTTLALLKKAQALLEQGDVSAAKQVANLVPEPEWRDYAYRMVIAVQMVNKDFRAAKQSVRFLHFPLSRAGSLVGIASQEAKWGGAYQKTLQEATTIALSISHAPTHDAAVNAIVAFYEQLGQFAKAKGLLNRVHDPHKRYVLLGRIARGEATGGDLRAAQTTLEAALRDAKGIPASYARDVFLRDILFVLLQLNDPDSTLRIANGMNESSNRATALAQVAALQAKVGSPVNARKTVQEARKVVPQIQDSHARDVARYEIVIALLALRDRVEASRLAGEIQDRDIKARALREIANTN